MSSWTSKVAIALTLAFGAGGGTMVAQQPTPVPPQSVPVPPRTVTTPIVVQTNAPESEVGKLVRCSVVVSRFQGEKRLSSLPYELMVEVQQTNPANLPAILRLGIDTLSAAPDGKTSYFVGTQIDCGVASRPGLAGNVYAVYLNVSESALVGAGENPNRVPYGIRTYSVRNRVLHVREGQSLQFSVGSDATTGEVTRAEVTVTTVK